MPDIHSLRVFISYARSDASDFAEELLVALEAAGFDPFLDRHDISGGEDWEARLTDLLKQADTVVYVLTPASVRSDRCKWEIECAASLSKRVIPVVAVDVAEAETPEPLRRLNYVFFSKGHSFGAGLKTLANALRTDLTWVREHTRLAELALRWDGRRRPEELLLRGSELGAAQDWLKNWKAGAPEPTTIHREFINTSDAAEQARTSAERMRLEERQRNLNRLKRRTNISLALAVLVLLLVAVSGSFVWQFQRQLSEKNRQLADKDANLAEVQQLLRDKTQDVEDALKRLNAVTATAASGTGAAGSPLVRPGAAASQLTAVQDAVQKARIGLGWDIDVFWCEGPGGDGNRSRAQTIVDRLNAESARQASTRATPAGGLPFGLGRIRLRTLTQTVNARDGYRVGADEVRAEASETQQADALRRFLAGRDGISLGARQSGMKTLYYLSVFVCTSR